MGATGFRRRHRESAASAVAVAAPAKDAKIAVWREFAAQQGHDAELIAGLSKSDIVQLFAEEQQSSGDISRTGSEESVELVEAFDEQSN